MLTRLRLFITAATVLQLCLVQCVAAAPGHVEVRTLSSQPDAVSGSDVLVQVQIPPHASWTASLNGLDVTKAFRSPNGNAGSLRALLSGLKPGRNRLTVRVNGGETSTLEIFAHSLAGPIFSGPHQKPFLCQTEANGLGPPLDEACSAKTVVDYYYKSSQPADVGSASTPSTLSPGFKPYDPAQPLPPDVAQTQTSDGRTVPYVIRRETGTLDRAVYRIQFLHPPGEPLPTPWTRARGGWNGRLLYIFRPETGSVSYVQGTLGATDAEQEPYLAAGYAVATSTLNIYGVTANDGLSAEVVSMVKERFIKQYGTPRHTVGVGESGGTIQQHLVIQNAPGLLDGLIDVTSFPDILTTVPRSSTDCALLDHAFKESTSAWTEAQRSAVSGFATWRTCRATMGLFGLSYVAPTHCNAQVPKNQIYDRQHNPTGVRCDLYSSAINVLGRDPHTGFAARPLDNVGVQYGLTAFNRGQITAEQFVELNEHVGGIDAEGALSAQRTEADAHAVERAYRRGLVLTGGGGLAEVPLIDWHGYTDDLADVHDRFRALVIRARLIAANGRADNQVILVGPRPELLSLAAPFVPQLAEYAADVQGRGVQQQRGLVQQMDRWLDRIEADGAPGQRLDRIARNKPADLNEGCLATDGQMIAEVAAYEHPGRCGELYPVHADPRIAAGEPLTDDVLKCALKPVNPGDYPQHLSASQLERVRAAFPGGVCDYGRPGLGQSAALTARQTPHVP